MNPWWQLAPCTGQDCLTGAAPAAGRVRRLARYAGGLAVALVAVVAALVLPQPYRLRSMALWARVLARALGVRLQITSPPGGGGRGVLLVANHISWLDVVLLMAYRPSRMVAKHEIVGYPVIGPLVSRIGTIIIERDRLHSLPGLVAEATAALRAGSTVVVFPEATTWCGRAMGDFRPAFFQAALDAGAAVQPVAVNYRLETGPVTTRPALIGDDTVLAALHRVVAANGLIAEAVALPEIVPHARHTRRTLARRSHAAITGTRPECAGPHPGPSEKMAT